MCYILWYDHVYHNWPHVNTSFGDITHIIIYSVLSISLFTIGSREENRIVKWFAFYSIAEFWAFLVLVMIYNTFIYNSVTYHKTLVSLTAVLTLNLIVGIIFFSKCYQHKSS
jgi:hypothetical protein